MSTVVKFPSAEKSLWDSVKKGVQVPAKQAGASNEQVDTFLEQFKPIFNQFMFNYEMKLPPMEQTIAEGVISEITRFQEELKKHNVNLLMERLMFEMKLFKW
ncbi:hypothetical protein QO198_17660 [Pseudoalteromonas distincta]|uniref:hypothetical protein n=1 Tax=Pseudoalteromonas distincta TaxID=77608 RepID=UPI00352EE5C9